MTIDARHTTEPATQYPPVVITGMSGAGLSTAARVLEDMGWFVTQNMPPHLVDLMMDAVVDGTSPVTKIAVVTDVRSLEFSGTLDAVLTSMNAKGVKPLVLFMDARDDVLIKRFDNLRRTHPLQGSGTLLVGIERERQLVASIRESADVVIDTSDMSIHDLRRAIEPAFEKLHTRLQHITVQSFGFKHGTPRDTDILIDVRFLPNPFWVPELRPFRGTDKPVSDYVLGQDSVKEFLDNFQTLLLGMRGGFKHEGKNFVTVSIGCTGGHHRSVAIAEELARRLSAVEDLDVTVNHRDISRH